jgi:hypothetical protein
VVVLSFDISDRKVVRGGKGVCVCVFFFLEFEWHLLLLLYY